MEPIKKIIIQQKVEERRNSTFYCQIRSMKNGDEYAWIHSMVCAYLHEYLCDKESDVEENKTEDEDTEKICDLLEKYETSLRWYHIEGIDKAIEDIKLFLKDKFIPYSTYLSYQDSKEYKNTQLLPEVFIKKILFSKL